MQSISGVVGLQIPEGHCIHFCRHGESLGNIAVFHGPDSPLSSNGREQAKLLSGHYDLILISPLRRTLETLLYSGITYDKVSIDYSLRERIFGRTDLLPNEELKVESDHDFWRRTHEFTELLKQETQKHQKILIIGHSYYFNAWYLQQCTRPLPNAIIHNLI
jgi:broad specificity phosphatase PhoE